MSAYEGSNEKGVVTLVSIVLVLIGAFGSSATLSGMIFRRVGFIDIGLVAEPWVLLGVFIASTVLGVLGVGYEDGWFDDYL